MLSAFYWGFSLWQLYFSRTLFGVLFPWVSGDELKFRVKILNLDQFKPFSILVHQLNNLVSSKLYSPFYETTGIIGMSFKYCLIHFKTSVSSLSELRLRKMRSKFKFAVIWLRKYTSWQLFWFSNITNGRADL